MSPTARYYSPSATPGGQPQHLDVPDGRYDCGLMVESVMPRHADKKHLLEEDSRGQLGRTDLMAFRKACLRSSALHSNFMEHLCSMERPVENVESGGFHQLLGLRASTTSCDSTPSSKDPPKSRFSRNEPLRNFSDMTVQRNICEYQRSPEHYPLHDLLQANLLDDKVHRGALSLRQRSIAFLWNPIMIVLVNRIVPSPPTP